MAVLRGEKEAVLNVIKIAESYGYGNLICHLMRVWSMKLMDGGLSEKIAIEATLHRHPYRKDYLDLGADYQEIMKGLKG